MSAAPGDAHHLITIEGLFLLELGGQGFEYGTAAREYLSGTLAPLFNQRRDPGIDRLRCCLAEVTLFRHLAGVQIL